MVFKRNDNKLDYCQCCRWFARCFKIANPFVGIGSVFFIKQIIEVFGNIKVSDLDTKTIEQWQSDRLKYNKPASVNRVLACLKHMVLKAVDWNMASKETLKRVRGVKFKEENNKRLRFLTVEESQTLIDCCLPHLKPIVTVALHTGMRRGEILGLSGSRWI